MDLIYQSAMYALIAYQQFVFGYMYTSTGKNYQSFLIILAFLCITTAVVLLCVFEIESQGNKKVWMICIIVFLLVEAVLVLLLNIVHDNDKHHTFHANERYLLVFACIISIACAVALIVEICKN